MIRTFHSIRARFHSESINRKLRTRNRPSLLVKEYHNKYTSGGRGGILCRISSLAIACIFVCHKLVYASTTLHYKARKQPHPEGGADNATTLLWELIFCLIHCIQQSENTPPISYKHCTVLPTHIPMNYYGGSGLCKPILI